MTGKPMAAAHVLAFVAFLTHASRKASSGSVPVARSYSARTCPPFHSMHGTPAFCAMMVLPILSPRAYMGGPAGPMKRMGGDEAWRALGRLGFSEAWPHPAQTAWTALSHASFTMGVTLA